MDCSAAVDADWLAEHPSPAVAMPDETWSGSESALELVALDLARGAAREVLDADRGTVFLYDDQSDEVRAEMRERERHYLAQYGLEPPW